MEEEQMKGRIDKVVGEVIWGFFITVLLLGIAYCNGGSKWVVPDWEIKEKRIDSLTLQVEALQAQNTAQLAILATKDSTIAKLKHEMEGKEDARSGLGFTGEVHIIAGAKTVVTHRDTFTIEDTTYVYPEYTGVDSNKYYNVKAVANKDTTKFDIHVEGLFTLVSFTDKKLFSRPKTRVELKSHNPYIKVKDLRYVDLTSIPRFNVVAYVGAGVGNGFKITPQVGVGLGVTLFTIK